MHEELVFALGRWRPRHRADVDCWCAPVVQSEGDSLVVMHRAIVQIAPDPRQRAFISGKLQAPI